MPFVAFLGCDGAGKSALIARLASSLEATGDKVVCGHWRPVSIGGCNAERAKQSADNPHGQNPRGVFTSILKLGWLWLNWWLGWWRELRKDRENGYVLFDRFHGDILADPCRYRYGGPAWAALLASRFMPQPDLVIFLDAEPSVLLTRKQEVTEESLIKSRSTYLSLCEKDKNYRIVDAGRSLEDVTAEVLQLLRALHS